MCAQIVGGHKNVRPNYSCIFTTNGEPWFGMLDIWAHPTCHPKAHRLSKKCMNNLGARFGRDPNMPTQGSPFVEKMHEKFGRATWAGPHTWAGPLKIWAHDLGGTPKNLGARFGRRCGGTRNLGARFGRDPPKFGRAHPIMMECVELCMEFKQTYINYEHLSYTAAYKHPKLQYRHDMHNCNIFRCAYQIDSYMCLSVHEYAYKVSKYGKQ